MIIGVPKEIKKNEYRVALTPAGIVELKRCNHTIVIETQAGEGSGYSDEDYKAAGAELAKDAKTVFDKAELILKVKEPLESEYKLIKEGQIVFTYFHFASSEELTKAMVQSKAICIAYETVEKDGVLPLLVPMSEVAGRMAVQEGAKYLEKHYQGRGVLLGGTPGVKPASVVILGGGIVGTHAATMAAGLGARVTLMDVNLARLRHLAEVMPANVTTLMSNTYNILEAIREADLVIGAVLIPGGKAPILVSRPMLKEMKKGAVLIDVAVDQGGCIETCTPTTHDNPTYIIDGIVHYCVANMPGAVPYTSTIALTNATLPYIVKLANKGWQVALKENPDFKKGLNICQGKIVYKKVAESFNLPFEEKEFV